MERGWRVTVVDRNRAERDGCSFGNAGMIVPSHFIPLAAPGAVGKGLKWMLDPGSPFYMKPRASWDLLDWALKFWKACNGDHVRRASPLLRDLNLASRACYEELAMRGDEFGLNKAGTLMLCQTAHALDEEAKTAESARALGLSAEVLDARATADLDPAVRMNVVGSVYFPDDCNVVPGRLVNALQRRLAAHGAQFIWSTEVIGCNVENRTIVAVMPKEGDAIQGDEFVLAAGAWSAKLARSLGLDIPMQGGKGYSLTLARPPVLPRSAAILTEARVAVSPMGDALRVGGTMEIAGLDQSVSARRVRSIIEAATRYYPDLAPADFDGIEPWQGLRPCSPDGLPYLGRTSRVSNLLLATGHAMMGVSLAPISGKLVSQLIAGEPPDIDIALLSPDRYH
jgi:D-amino-acid dehydrogenase